MEPTHTRRRHLKCLGSGIAAATLAGCLSNRPEEVDSGGSGGVSEDPQIEYETTGVRIETDAGDELATVTADIADTPELHETGLSETESLPDDRGMLFVFDEAQEHNVVMFDMVYGIDIIFADEDGRIDSIEHAEAPDPDEDREDRDGREYMHLGYGKYILEVNKNWTDKHGISEGDILVSDRIDE